MDPLTLITAIITVAGASSKVIQILITSKDFESANKKVKDLIDEIADFQAIVLIVKDALNRSGTCDLFSNDTRMRLIDILRRGQMKLDDIIRVLENRLLRPRSTPGELRVGRIRWFCEKANIRELQQDFKSLTVSICTIWQTLTMCVP